MTLGDDVPSTDLNSDLRRIHPIPKVRAEPLITTEDRRSITLESLQDLAHPMSFVLLCRASLAGNVANDARRSNPAAI
jgi:hypothetical protein